MVSIYQIMVLCCLLIRDVNTQEHIADVLPQFWGDLSNVTVPVGREASFTCNIKNLGNYKVGWVRADTKAILTLYDTIITHDPRIKLTGDFITTFNLRIANVQQEDRGVYMCQINTDPMISIKAQLDVNIPPDIDNDRTSPDVDAKLGSTVTIKCNANGHPIPTIKWIREDKQLIKTKDSNSGRIVKFDQTIGPDLVIPNIDTTDMGSYLCIADNGVPPIVSKRIYVYVQFAPEVSTKAALIGVVENGPVNLVCTANAYPKAMVEWMRYDSVVRSNGAWKVNETEVSIFSKRKTLQINRAQKDNMGKYVCRASNSIGAVDAQVQLYLIEAPKNIYSTEIVAPPTKEIETTETIHFNTPEDYKNRQHFINEIGGGNRKTDYNVDKHNTNIISYDILDSGNNDESKKKSRKFGSGFMASSKASLPLMLQKHCVLLPMAAGTTTILMVMTVLLLLLPYLSNNI